MANISEVQSLNDIQYKSKIKLILLFPIILVIFVFSFLSFYPIGGKIKSLIKTGLKSTSCHPDFNEIRFEWLMPKIVVSDLTIPAACLMRSGQAIQFSQIKINYQLINFAPFGLPFKVETEFEDQHLEFYFVQGFDSHMIRVKDQQLNLVKIRHLLSENLKLSGNLTLDFSLLLSNNKLTTMAFKAQSKNLQLPSQNIQGFTTPPVKLNEFYIEASSDRPPRVIIDKLIAGDSESPVRANFKGSIELMENQFELSPIDLVGEIAFSQSLKTQLPLVDMIFQTFNQKDGFYQIKIGGTIASPRALSP